MSTTYDSLKKKLPFNIISSSVTTGYNSEISSSFAPGVDITNLHGDTYHTFEDAPAQGPFTQAHVGGNQHRHVDLNTGSEGADTRPEAFRIDLSNAGELRVYGPDQAGTSRPRASLLRDGVAKSSLNIANIRHTTGSQVLGNFKEDYEVVQISSRGINNRYLAKAGGLPTTILNTQYVRGLPDFELPDRENTGSNKFVFVQRFNAPGGTDVSSRGVLDPASEEYAANNALSFRNMSVRQSLRALLRQHTDQFGYSNGSEQTASFHKVNRNTRFKPGETSSCIAVYDNGFVQHSIPSSDLRYAWITASAITGECTLYGYQRSGSATNKSQAYTDIQFVGKRINSASQQVIGDFVGITGSDKSATVSTDTHVWSNPSLQLWINNGAYEYPLWKQLRTGEHPIARALRESNIIAVQNEPQQKVVTTSTKKRTFKGKRGDTFANFIETPVSSRYKPVEHYLTFKGAVNPLIAHQISHTYANNLGGFANKDLELRLGSQNLEEQMYDRIYDFYADPDLPESDNPVSRFLALRYKEGVYPREENAYLSFTRGRSNFAEIDGTGANGRDRDFGQQKTFWKDDNSDLRSSCSRNSQGYRFISEKIYPEGDIWDSADTSLAWNYAAVDRSNNGNNARIAVMQGDSNPSLNGVAIYEYDESTCSWEQVQSFYSNGARKPSFSGSYLAVTKNSYPYDGVAVFKSGSSGFVEETVISGNSGYTSGAIDQTYSSRTPSIYGNKLAIGYPKNDLPANDSGGFEIWGSSSASGWRIEEEISGTYAYDEFGKTLRLYGSTLVVGKPGYDLGSMSGIGAIYVYDSSSAGGWSETQRIDGEFTGEKFCDDGIDFDGEHIIAWNSRADVNGFTNNGVLKIFKKNFANTWIKEYEIAGEYNDAKIGDNYGASFGETDNEGAALWNGMVVVKRTLSGSSTKVVDVYERFGDRDWRKTSVIKNLISGSNSLALRGLNNKVIGLGDSDIDYDEQDHDDAGIIYPILRNSWGFNNTELDDVGYQTRGFSPLRTDGIYSFAGSSSYRERNGELLADSDASLYKGQPTPSLCFVETVESLVTIPVSGTQYYTDYIERLTEEITGRHPWFDTYEDYADDLRRTGKEHSIVPEFRTSEHMSYYVSENNGNFRAANKKLFSILGANISSSADTEEQRSYDVDFKAKYLTSERLRYFDEIKKEHKDIAAPSRLTLRCKGIKKLLPYQGFYPQNRTVQIGTLLSQSIGPFIEGYSGSDTNSGFAPHGLQALLKPFVSPGILYNSIKSGIAVDYPIYTSSAPAVKEEGATTSEFVLQDAPNYRLPFESLVQLTEHLPKGSPVRFISSYSSEGDDTQVNFPYYFKWNGNKDSLYELAMHNFLAETPNFFLSEGQLNSFSSAPEFQFKSFVQDRKYYMDVVLRQNVENNKFPTYVGTGSIRTDESRNVEPPDYTGSSADAYSSSGVRLDNGRMVTATTLGPNYDGTSDTKSGSVFIYNNRGELPWQLEAVITGNANIPNWEVNAEWATSVDISNNYLAVGATDIDSNAGGVFVFKSGSSGWEYETLLAGRVTGDYLGSTVRISGSYIFCASTTTGSDGDGGVLIYKSGSSGWALEETIFNVSTFSIVSYNIETDRGTLIIVDSGKSVPTKSNCGTIEVYRSSSANGWTLEHEHSGSKSSSSLGFRYGASVSGNYFCVVDDFNFATRNIEFYRSGSSSWNSEQTIILTGSFSQDYLGYNAQFSVEEGYLVMSGYSPTGDAVEVGVWRSGSSGWALETSIDSITGSFDVSMNGAGLSGLDVYGNVFSIANSELTLGDGNEGAIFSFVSQSSDCDALNGYASAWFPLFGTNTGEINQKQNGKLFGMALPVSGGTTQFNKSFDVYDPAYMAYTPPSFYGEAVARISFTPSETRQYTLEEIFENCEVENILNQEESRVASLASPVIAETGSLAYQNKMPVSASVTLFGKFSEPNLEFDIANSVRSGLRSGFTPSKATKSETTNKNRWSIGTKFECPVLDVAAYDNEYSSSYSSHVTGNEGQVFCGIENLEFETPRTPWTNYSDVLPDSKGVFFDLRESFSPDLYNNNTGSLLQNCGFTAGRKKIGRLADSKEISEAIVAIPYVDKPIEGVTVRNESDCNKNFIAIDSETLRTQRENLEKLGIAVKREETSEGKTQKSSTTITDMIQKMKKFVIPPQMDFVKYEDIEPFAMYIFDFSTVLNKRDLINIWHGIMPEPSIRMEKDEIVITHEMNKDEFFHGKELPDNIRWMVFKVKQRAKHNYFEITSDASDDDRFKFSFQGDGKVEVVPDLNFNWPYDYFSLVELSKIEVEVELNNKNEIEKLERQAGSSRQAGAVGRLNNTIGAARGRNKK